MKNHNRSTRANPTNVQQKEGSFKTQNSLEKQTVHPLNVEEGAYSARNWKIDLNPQQIALDSLKTRGLISPMFSPKSQFPNTSYSRQNLSYQKHQEKQNAHYYPTENQQSFRLEPSLHALNSSNEAQKYKSTNPVNMMTFKDTKSMSPKNSFFEVFKKIPLINQDNISANGYILNSERSFAAEISSARDFNPYKGNFEGNHQRKTVSNYPLQAKTKQNQIDDNLNIKGSAIAPNSPLKSYGDGIRAKEVLLKAKEQSFAANFSTGSHTSRNIANNEFASHVKDAREEKSESPSRKASASKKQPLSDKAIQPGSETSRRLENQSSRDNIYFKEFVETEERQYIGRLPVKKSEKSLNAINLQILRTNKQRPDSSFDRHHLYSVRSVDFYQSAPLEDEHKPLGYKGLTVTHLDILDTDDRFKKSQKSFNNFHSKIFTESSKRAVEGQSEVNNHLIVRIAKDNKTLEGQSPSTIDTLKPNETFDTVNGNNVEALISPRLKNEKVSDVNIQSRSERLLIMENMSRQEYSNREAMSSRRHPNTTRNKTFRPNEFGIPIGDQSADSFYKKMTSISQHIEKDQPLANKSLTVSFQDRSQNYSNNDKIDKPSGADETEDKSSNVSNSHQEKRKDFDMNTKLREIYLKIKTDLEKNKVEKNSWMEERKYLLGKIEALEKRVADLEQKNSEDDQNNNNN